jgi:hypothetical protein
MAIISVLELKIPVDSQSWQEAFIAVKKSWKNIKKLYKISREKNLKLSREKSFKSVKKYSGKKQKENSFPRKKYFIILKFFF